MAEEADEVVGILLLTLKLGVVLGELSVGVLVGGTAPEPEDNDEDEDEDADTDVVVVEDGMKMPPGVECDAECDVEGVELDVRSVVDLVAEEVLLGVGDAVVLFRREVVIGITMSDGEGAASEADEEEEADLVDVTKVLPPSREEAVEEIENVEGVGDRDEGEIKSNVDDGKGNNNDESIEGTDFNDSDDDEEDTYTTGADAVGRSTDEVNPGPAGALADPDGGAPPLPLPPLPPTTGLADMGWPVTQSSGRAAVDETLTKSGPGSG